MGALDGRRIGGSTGFVVTAGALVDVGRPAAFGALVSAGAPLGPGACTPAVTGSSATRAG